LYECRRVDRPIPSWQPFSNRASSARLYTHYPPVTGVARWLLHPARIVRPG
jgi:hypothetical protein